MIGSGRASGGHHGHTHQYSTSDQSKLLAVSRTRSFRNTRKKFCVTNSAARLKIKSHIGDTEQLERRLSVTQGGEETDMAISMLRIIYQREVFKRDSAPEWTLNGK